MPQEGRDMDWGNPVGPLLRSNHPIPRSEWKPRNLKGSQCAKIAAITANDSRRAVQAIGRVKALRSLATLG